MLEDKQDTSRAEGMHTAACGEMDKLQLKKYCICILSLYKKKKGHEAPCNTINLSINS